MRGGFSPQTVAEWRSKYYRRFKGLVALRPEGFVLYELPQVETDGSPFESVVWDDERVIVERMLAHFSRLVHVETEPGWKWFMLRGPRG